jgi:hypothetical protein
MSLIFSNLVVIKTLSSNHRMYNLYAKFVKILEICKQFSENLVNDSGNVPRRGPVPKFSDLEVVALSLTAETESIDSEKWLFDYKLQEYKDSIPNLISRRQFNDRRKKTSGLCEELRKRIAMEMDGGEEQFFVDSKPIEVCRVARGKRCKMGRAGNFSQAPDFGFCASQNTYYFGYKLHALCGLSGVIHSYDLSKASVADLHYMKDVKHTYHDCSIYGDKGYIGADVQLDLFETAHIRLECPYRLNQKDWKPTFIPFAKARKRMGLRRNIHRWSSFALLKSSVYLKLPVLRLSEAGCSPFLLIIVGIALPFSRMMGHPFCHVTGSRNVSRPVL